MTSTVWAPTLDELRVCVYVRFVCERGRVFCLCARAPPRVCMRVSCCASVHAARSYSWLLNVIVGDDHLYIAW